MNWRLGELIAAQKATVGLAQGKRTDLVPSGNQVDRPTLADAGTIAVPQENRIPTLADAAEIRMRAERRLGELIAAQKVTVGLARGGEQYHRSTGSEREPVPTLADAGLSVHAKRALGTKLSFATNSISGSLKKLGPTVSSGEAWLCEAPGRSHRTYYVRPIESDLPS